jgi:hypothetical protein
MKSAQIMQSIQLKLFVLTAPELIPVVKVGSQYQNMGCSGKEYRNCAWPLFLISPNLFVHRIYCQQYGFLYGQKDFRISWLENQ